MNDIEKQLLAASQQVQHISSNLCKEYLPKLADLPALARELERLRNRSQEYEHGTFITLVVGPAKSGKSTLVNLIAGDYVSPTNFLECTVRPSIISRRKEGSDSSLTCYYTKDNTRRVEQIDSIIDSIRGFSDDSALSGISKEILPLTPETIKEKVELSLEESLDSETLLTSIRTPGGRLLQERVFLIDMPGFDGAYENIDNPVYDAIAQRADLIVFVQSSNSAFSKVSKDFLRLLAARNANVPVCLIHNVFDAAWWRTEKEKEEAIESQRESAYNEIRKLGFGIDRAHCFCINLGQVRDYRSGNYPALPQLEAADKQFDAVEEILFNRIISNRDTIRLTNCLKRVAQQRDRLKDDLRKQIERRKEKIAEWERIAAEVSEIVVIKPVEVPEITSNTAAAISAASFECRELRSMISEGTKKSMEEARELIQTLLVSLSDALKNRINDIFSVTTAENTMYATFKQEMADLSHKLSRFKGYISPETHPKITISETPGFYLLDEIDVETLVPRRTNMLGLSRKHTADELKAYMQSVEEILITSPDHLGAPQNNGRLIRTVIPAAETEVKEKLAAIALKYDGWLKAFADANQKSIKAALISDKENFVKETADLESLLGKLEALKLRIE